MQRCSSFSSGTLVLFLYFFDPTNTNERMSRRFAL
jgi:hypothetical protein